MYCKKKLSSQCEKTNSNKIENGMYGGNTAGMFGYSHFTGGFAGGQAEYVRVPCGDVNLLKLPDNVPDEKGLFLSDVVSTSWNCVVDTGVKEGDVVAIWGAGPIGQMCADFSFMNGASRVIMIDQNWRLDYVKSKYPKVETLDFSKDKNVVAKLKEMVENGPDVALECVAGEYPKSWSHTVELAAGLETDTSEILNEMIESVRNYGRVGITGVYVGYVGCFYSPSPCSSANKLPRPTTSTLARSWSVVFASLVTVKLQSTSTGRSFLRRFRAVRSTLSRWLPTEFVSRISTRSTTSSTRRRTACKRSLSRQSSARRLVLAAPS